VKESAKTIKENYGVVKEWAAAKKKTLCKKVVIVKERAKKIWRP
jgi:hypothetical protein